MEGADRWRNLGGPGQHDASIEAEAWGTEVDIGHRTGRDVDETLHSSSRIVVGDEQRVATGPADGCRPGVAGGGEGSEGPETRALGVRRHRRAGLMPRARNLEGVDAHAAARDRPVVDHRTDD